MEPLVEAAPAGAMPDREQVADTPYPLERLRLPSEREIRAALEADAFHSASVKPGSGTNAAQIGLRNRCVPFPDSDLLRRGELILALLGSPHPGLDMRVLPEPALNAFTLESDDHQPLTVVFTSGLLNTLADDAAALGFVLGHEIAHPTFGHGRGAVSVSPESVASADPRLQRFALQAQSLSRRQEVACDRAGLLACGSPEGARRAVLTSWLCSQLAPALPVASEVPDARGPRFFDQEYDAPAPWTLSHPTLEVRLAALGAAADAGLHRPVSGPDLAARLTVANHVSEALLDGLERDDLKLDRGLVHEFFAHVRQVLGDVCPESNWPVGVAVELDRLAGGRPAGLKEDSLVFLRREASLGRRLRLLDLVASVGARPTELVDLGRRLGLPESVCREVVNREEARRG